MLNTLRPRQNGPLKKFAHKAGLTHWGWVTHICVKKLTIIGSDNGLSPDRRQAIIWTNDGILLIGPLGTNFSEIFIGIHTFSFNKMHLKMSSGKCRPFCLGLNVLTHWGWNNWHFHIHFLEWKLLYCDADFYEVCYQGPNENKSALVQVMAQHQAGEEPLSEPMMA